MGRSAVPERAGLKESSTWRRPRRKTTSPSSITLATAARVYKVESKAVGTSWKGDKIFSHGFYIYLMGPDGSFATLLPPILDPQAMAKTIRSYL